MTPQAKEWKATKNTARTFTGIITVFHGGPGAGMLPEHSHPEAEVSVHFHSNKGGSLVFKHAHLYAPERPHSGGWKSGHEVVVLLFSPRLLEDAAEEMLRRGHFEISTLKYLRDRMFEQSALAIAREFRVPDLLGRFYVESIGNALAGYILRTYAESYPRNISETTLTEKELRKIRRFVEERIETGFSVTDLAGTVSLGPQEFRRKLRLTVGLPPWQYVNSLRLSMAAQMLKSSRLPIAEVAHRLGFVDQSHFTNVFRRMSGVTPMAFRRS